MEDLRKLRQSVAQRSTTISSAIGRMNTPTTTGRATSTSVLTPTSRRTLFRRSPYGGRRHERKRVARHRRCRHDKFEIPMVKRSRRPAHRPAGDREGGPAGRLGRSRQGRFRLQTGYAKGLRTVKTCRLRLVPLRRRIHTGLDIRIKKFMCGALDAGQAEARHLRLRNCAEATCKDIGVICVDGGLIHFAGAAV